MARPNPPVTHLLVAMAVIMLPALLAVWWFQRVPPPPINRVDPAPVVAEARASGFVPAVPQLPDGWTCTRARWTPKGEPGLSGASAPGGTLALGYLSPAQQYFAVDQRDAAPDALIADATRKGGPDGTSTVGGRTWQRYRSSDGRTMSLVLREGDKATVVSGDVTYEGLETFASTLRFGG